MVPKQNKTTRPNFIPFRFLSTSLNYISIRKKKDEEKKKEEDGYFRCEK